MDEISTTIPTPNQRTQFEEDRRISRGTGNSNEVGVWGERKARANVQFLPSDLPAIPTSIRLGERVEEVRAVVFSTLGSLVSVTLIERGVCRVAIVERLLRMKDR